VDYSKRMVEHAPILIDGAVVEQDVEHQQTVMVQAHQGSCEEGTTMPIPRPETEKIWHGSSDPQSSTAPPLRAYTGRINAWNGNCSASDRKAPQRVVRTAQYITRAKLPANQDRNTRWCQRKDIKMAKDSSHPSHRQFSLLQHGKRYSSAKSRSKRLLKSFYPKAIRLLNSYPYGYPENLNLPPFTHFYVAATLCLLSMHSHFTSTDMNILQFFSFA
jgi:hypothetical protein